MASVVDAFGHMVLRSVHEEMKDYRSMTSFERSKYYSQGLDRTIEEHIDDLANYGIDKQVVTQQPPHLWTGLDPDEALPLVKSANDELADIANRYTQWFHPVATIPFLGGPYVEEAERCLNDLGMVGFQIFTNCRGRPIDDEAYIPLFEIASDRGVPIWLHPSSANWDGWSNITDYSLPLLLGWPFETSVAMARLVLGGTMDHYNLNVICHHMGGATAHLADRLGVFRADLAGAFSEGEAKQIIDGLRRFYADTARQGAESVLKSGYDFFGADKMVFGTDYPFGPDGGRWFLRREKQAVENLEIPPQDKRKILGENIERIIPPSAV